MRGFPLFALFFTKKSKNLSFCVTAAVFSRLMVQRGTGKEAEYG